MWLLKQLKYASWIDWINFLFLQWFFIRLTFITKNIKVSDDNYRTGDANYAILFFIHPLTGFAFSNLLSPSFITVPANSKIKILDLTKPKEHKQFLGGF